MKKNKLVYVLGALLSMGVVSCDLTEKPTSFYEMDTYFTTADKAKMAVIGIYDCRILWTVCHAVCFVGRYVYG